MTVPSTPRRAGPYTGNGSNTIFPFHFKVFAATDIKVLVFAGDASTTLQHGSQYTVTLNGNQDVTPGGFITTIDEPLWQQHKLVIVGNLPYDQTTDLPPGGNFSAAVHENSFDRMVMQIQQLAERSLRQPIMRESTNVNDFDIVFPAPQPDHLIGWNHLGNGFRNIDPLGVVTLAGFTTWNNQTFNGGGSIFNLSSAPGSIKSLTVIVDGLTLTPGIDYTVSGASITTTLPTPTGVNNVFVRWGEALPSADVDLENVDYILNKPGAVLRDALSKLGDVKSLLDFGADPTGISDSTAAIQAAINSCAEVIIPEGIFSFTSLTISKRNFKLRGEATRRCILRHTGSGAAIVCVDPSTTEPDGRGSYIDSGYFEFHGFTLLVNGTFGFRVGKTLSSFTTFSRLYIRHRRDTEAGDPNNNYFAGSVAIDCDNTPWNGSAHATYLSSVKECLIRGFETAVNLQDVVNGWTLDHAQTLSCKKQVVLSGANALSILRCYFESAVAGATGIQFLAGGGNGINVSDTTFELTNASGTQYAYSFVSGTWKNINVWGCKYLIQSDGNAVNSRRITGTAPETFIEWGRSFTSTAYGETPFVWKPSGGSAPLQFPSMTRLGGIGQGAGRLIFGRNADDTNNLEIAHDGTNGLNVITTSGIVRFNDASGNVRWEIDQPNVCLAPGDDNVRSLGRAARRVSQLFSANATINTSDENEKESIGDIPDSWLDAWSDVQWRRFKMKDSVAQKGDGSRWHTGLIAQRVRAAFEAEGIDALAIGLLCLDRWIDDDGIERERYGIRYEEALSLEAALMRRSTKRLELRIAQLEKQTKGRK